MGFLTLVLLRSEPGRSHFPGLGQKSQLIKADIIYNHHNNLRSLKGSNLHEIKAFGYNEWF